MKRFSICFFIGAGLIAGSATVAHAKPAAKHPATHSKPAVEQPEIIPVKPPFNGADFSGVYDCNGNDDHEGKYTGTVTLELVPTQSTEQYGAYNFKLEVPDYGVYLGHGAAHGAQMAIYFALTDPTTKDFGTGITSFVKDSAGKWSFHKYYYEPEFMGGNFGSEDCTQR